MEKQSAQISIGIGGWEHEGLDHCFYPHPNGDSLQKLEFYSRFFTMVEIRSTFWDDTLSGCDARQWVEAVASTKRFSFVVKLHSAFTHRKKADPTQATNMTQLLDELAKAGRLAGVLAQFPFSFTNTAANRFHLERLGTTFGAFPLFAELRHETWDQPRTLEFLAGNHMHIVNADLPRLRNMVPFTTSIVGGTAYLRLHGRNENGWLINGMDTRYDYLYNGRELRELERRIGLLAMKCRRIFISFNNTTHAKAVPNAFQLKSAVEARGHILVPRAVLSRFPQLKDVTTQINPERAGVQGETSLFEEAGYRKAV